MLPVYVLLWTLLFLKQSFERFSNIKLILMSLLIAYTIVILFSQSSSLLSSSFKSSIFSKCHSHIFLLVLCTSCPKSALFSTCVNGIRAKQKYKVERMSPWNILLNGLLLQSFTMCFKVNRYDDDDDYYYYFYYYYNFVLPAV